MKINFYNIIIILSFFVGCTAEEERKLPILGNREPVEKNVGGKTVVDTVYQTIPDFAFTNQDGKKLTSKDFQGKIYVADFFFTSCPSICPVMHRNMLKIFDEFKGNEDVKLLSHSIDFKYDTPPVLKKYATKLGVEGNQWEFVTGTKDSVYTIAERSYLTAVGEDSKAKGGYIHQGWFVLVDKERRLRGAYDGTNEEQVEQLIEDIKILLEEK